MQVPPGYALQLATPTVDDHARLRRIAGLSEYPRASAEAGLAHSFIGVVVEHDGAPVGMGRIVGDGGLFFQLVDIAVDPAHQGKGIGKAIVAALLAELRRRIPARAYVSLIADGEANRLYAAHGFGPVTPKSIGMSRWIDPA